MYREPIKAKSSFFSDITNSEQQPNDTLLSLFFNSITDLIDCEVPLTSFNCENYSAFVKENCKENREEDPEYQIQLGDQPVWKCYAGASRRSIIIMLIPATLTDVGKVLVKNCAKISDAEEALGKVVKEETASAKAVDSSREIDGETTKDLETEGEDDDATAEYDSTRELRNSVSVLEPTDSLITSQRPYLPIFIYECKFSTISDIQSKPGTGQCTLIDYTSKLGAYHGESGNIHARLPSEDISERSTEISAFCKTLSDRFFQTFVNGVFKNLQHGFGLNSNDVESSVEMICEESCLEIDITSFIRVICMHFRKEQMDDDVFDSVLDSSVVIKRSGKHSSGSTNKSTPRTPVTNLPKCGSETVHKFAQNSFQEILETKFSRVPHNFELFYYNANEDQVLFSMQFTPLS